MQFHHPVDRVILINQGQVLFNGRPDELLRTTLLGRKWDSRTPLFNNSSPAWAGYRSIEHLDRLEDIELTGESFHSATFTKTGEAEELLKLEQISFAYQENHPP